MTVREIAEKLNANTSKGLFRSIPDMQVADLLDAYVEERAKFICEATFNHRWAYCHDEKRNHWRTQALNELDLTDAWPPKEKG